MSTASHSITFGAWILDLLASDMSVAEKVVTIAAVMLQTASNDALAIACGVDRRTVIRAKAAPAKKGWLHIGGVAVGGRGNAPSFRPGHPKVGCSVNFIHGEDAKQGQFVTLLVHKEWQAATVSGAKEGQDVTLPAGKGDNNEGQPATLSGEKGDRNARKGGGNEGQVATVSPPRVYARAQKESPSGIVNINRLSEDSHPLTPSAPAASAVCEGEILGPNEELLGHGVISNCETIRHAAFVISLPGVEIGALAAGMSRDEVKQHCISHALQWAAEIESGKPVRDVVPAKIANFLSASLMGVRNRSQRVPRAPSPNSPRVAAGATGESQLERTARQVAAARARLEGRA